MRQEEKRPDTSKNGMLKRNQLQLREESVKERGRSVVDRLNARKKRVTNNE